MKRLPATTDRHVRLVGLIFLATLLGICANVVTTARGAPVSLTRTLFPHVPVLEFAGVRIFVRARRGSLALAASLTNGGKRPVTLLKGSPLRWRPRMFDRTGRAIQSSHAQWQPGRFEYLAPGGVLRKVFALDRYYTLPRTGVFYVYLSGLVVAGKWDGGSMRGVEQKYVRSAILRLTLRKGSKPSWKIVASVPVWERVFPTRPPEPPYPKFKVPSTGPIATLAAISRAVDAGDLRGVQRLCCDSGYGPGFFVAMAHLAIATRKYCQALKRRFGADPEVALTRRRPTPETFAHFLAELDPATLRVSGHTASVGILWFHGGKFMRMPGFSFRFHQVKGQWLLDQRATYPGTATAGGRHLNIRGDLRQAKIFGSLARAVASGRLGSLRAAYAATDHELARETLWSVGRRHGSEGGLPAPGVRPGPGLAREYWGVRISLRADPKRAAVVATISNRGRRTAIVWHGGPFSWRLLVFNARGWGLGVTKAQQKRWQAPQPGERRIHLRPGASLSRIFHVRRYCVLPAQGIFYLYVTRFVAVGGASCPVASPILRLTLKRGALPAWKVVSAVPQPKLRPPAP